MGFYTDCAKRNIRPAFFCVEKKLVKAKPQNSVFSLGKHRFEVRESFDYHKMNNNYVCHVHTAYD